LPKSIGGAEIPSTFEEFFISKDKRFNSTDKQGIPVLDPELQ